MTKYYPAEWTEQKTVWLSFPHNQEEWGQVETQNALKQIRSFYRELVEKILDYQNLDLIFNDQGLLDEETSWLKSLEDKKYKLTINLLASLSRLRPPVYLKNYSKQIHYMN